MNERTPCWPLFRNELCLDHYPKIPWTLSLGFFLAVWLMASFMPSVILFKACEGNLAIFFTAFGDLFGFALVWWLAMAGWLFAFALLPGISNPVQSVRAFEFMFTRAIDRRRLFRMRAAVILVALLSPLLINVLASIGARETHLGLDAADSTAAAIRRTQYLKAFPASRPSDAKSESGTAPLVIPRGALVLTGGILWSGALGLLLMQGYCVLIARQVKDNPWLAGAAIGAPVVITFILAPWLPRLYPAYGEAGFLFFAQNLVPLVIGLLALWPVVQIYSERKFNELEIL